MPRFEDLLAEGQALVEVGGVIAGVDIATQAELTAATTGLASETYVDTAIENATYLPLAGGTLAGTLAFEDEVEPDQTLRSFYSGQEYGLLLAPGDGATDSTGQLTISPKGTGGLSGSTANALVRLTMNDIGVDATNLESVSFEAHSGGYYSIKSRVLGSGAHRPFLFQIGGRNALWVKTDGNVHLGARDAPNTDTGTLIVRSDFDARPGIQIRNNRWYQSQTAAGLDAILLRIDASDYVHIGDNLAARNGRILFNAAGATLMTLAYPTLTFLEAIDLVFGTTTGSKIGSASTQKLAFWGATPVVRPTGIADATAEIADVTAKFNSLLAKLETIGILAVA